MGRPWAQGFGVEARGAECVTREQAPRLAGRSGFPKCPFVAPLPGLPPPPRSAARAALAGPSGPAGCFLLYPQNLGLLGEAAPQCSTHTGMGRAGWL